MWLIDLIITVAPLIGYYSQLQLIRQRKSIGSFSIDVCAILLISAILRIYFWFTNGYAVNLLFQAILMIIIQLLLLYQCILVTAHPIIYQQQQIFWRWQTFQPYLKFLFIFTGVVGVTTFLCKIVMIPYYGNVLGFISLSIQSALGIPQLLSNYRSKSVEGLSIFMIFTWFVGDLFKTIYFVVEEQPVQFVICGIIQLIVDILIIMQILKYKDNKIVQSSQYPQYEIITNNTNDEACISIKYQTDQLIANG